jgi:glycosyltransferase involved in cell wall biosynthesis
MSTKLISIILPVYNVENYIEKAVLSVLKQTYVNFELLIINDGTKDNSIQKIEKYASDSRLKIFHKENGGLSDARNFGLERVQGDYVYFMDSDDWIEPNLLTLCIDKIEKENANVVVFGYFLDTEDKNGNLISSKPIIHESEVVNHENRNETVTNTTIGLLGYAWNKFYATNFLKQHTIKFEKGVSLVEDILFNAPVFSSVNSIHFINKPLYHYANRPITTLIKTFHANSFDLYLKKNESLKKLFKKWEIDHYNELLASSLLLGIRYCANNLFAFKNDLTEKQKYNHLKAMIVHPETQRLIPFYKPNSKLDSIYKTIISQKRALLLYLILKIIK